MSSSCSSNSSNLSGNLNINNISSSGARLLMTLPLDGFSGGQQGYVGGDGITAGNAIRYDNVITSTSYGKYVKAQADAPANSEVIGIVEDITQSNLGTLGGTVTVVISGQVEYPTSKLNTSYEYPSETGGGGGGNDVYFLSAATAGVLQNLAPTEETQVIKPIYQVAPDDSWTGQVVNYIGYQAGGQVVAQDFNALPVGAMATVPQWPGRVVDSKENGWILFGEELNLDPGTNNKVNTYGHAYSNGLGSLSQTNVRIYTKTSPSSTMKGQTFKISISGRVRVSGKITQISAAHKWIDVNISSTYYDNISQYIIANALISLNSGGFLTVSETGFKYLSYVLPEVSENTQGNKISLIVDGKEKTYRNKHYLYANKDSSPGEWASMAGLAVAMPNEISNINKLTVNELHISDTTTSSTYAVDNLAITLNDMKDELETLFTKFYGAGHGKSINRVTKS